MDSKGKLPDLPASDRESLEKNRYDGFYQVGARDFWENAEVNYADTEEIMPECDHYFFRRGSEAVCKKCSMALFGSLEIADGKLFYKGKPLGI